MGHIYNYFRKAFQKISDLIKNPVVFIYLLSAILITIPLKYAFGSISCMLFLAVSFSTIHKIKFSYNKALTLPILFYCLMVLSLLWTRDLKSTLAGLQKEILFLMLPLAFLFIPKLSREAIYKVFRIFSFSMVFYAVYYFIKAIFRYFESGNTTVFFYHELVTKELNAIYVSVFASFALFYFIALKNKALINRISVFILVVFVFLLSSKNIILIDFLLIAIFYIFFSKVPNKIKYGRLTILILLLISSVVFVKQIRERFQIEYQTAFTDNTQNTSSKTVYNISLRQAWCDNQFQTNNYFSGSALRVYQIRIFKEMVDDENILFTGFGLEASQDKIREKARQHHLYPEYGEFNFHNQYVQTFAELGIFGLLILLLMLYYNLKNAVVHKNFLHIVFAVTMITLFLTESFFCRQRGVIFFITIYCLFNTINSIKTKIVLK